MEGVIRGTVELPTGARVAYTRCGGGEPVVILHGIADSSRAWGRVLLPVAEHHDVIAIDLPGCGRSDKPDTDYSLGAQAAAVRLVLDELGLEVVTLVGHSLGGGVAMTFAWLYPERVGRLALVSSAGLGRELPWLFRLATLPGGVPAQVVRVLFDRRVRTPRNALQSWLARRFGDPLVVDVAAHRAEVEKLLVGMEDPGAQRAFLRMLRSSADIGGQAISALDRLACAHLPVLIVWGRQDAVFPLVHADAAARLLPHARVIVLEGCGHMPHLEAPAALSGALLHWLRATRPTPVTRETLAGARAMAR